MLGPDAMEGAACLARVVSRPHLDAQGRHAEAMEFITMNVAVASEGEGNAR
jgi:hypothetical protein